MEYLVYAQLLLRTSEAMAKFCFEVRLSFSNIFLATIAIGREAETDSPINSPQWLIR